MDGGVDLEPAKKCLQQKCPAQSLPLQRLSDATLPSLRASSTVALRPSVLLALACAALAVLAAVVGLLRSRPASSAVLEDVE